MSQKTIPLPTSTIETIEWHTPERRYYSKMWGNEVVTNVSQASRIAYLPDAALRTGTVVLICPGGGMYGLSIVSEGTAIAEWLQERGVADFVLKYRLVPTGVDGTVEISQNWELDVLDKARQLLPFANRDAQNAIQFIRENSTSMNINPDHVGIMGFSAGSAVTMELSATAVLYPKPILSH